MSTFAFIPVTMVGRQKFNTKVHLHRSTYQFARTLERSIIYKICEQFVSINLENFRARYVLPFDGEIKLS